MVRRLNKSTKEEAEEITKVLKKKPEKESNIINPDNLIPSGSTLLNLACSDVPFGAYKIGSFVNLIGDTSAGKSILSLTMLAEVCNCKRFDKYNLYYDDTEKTFEFDLDLFGGIGGKFDKRVKIETHTYAEEVGDYLALLIKKDEPFIYITDSWDQLKSKYEEKKEKINIGKRARDQKEEGDYGDGKAKILHKFCRQYLEGIEKLDSLWVLVSQTKDNWGFDAQFNPKIVTGGNAIKFFPTYRVWLTNGLSERVKQRIIGGETKAKIVKNKFTGKKRHVFFPIYEELGVDDVGSCVRFLNGDWGDNHWKTRTRKNPDTGKSVTAIDAVELDVFLKETELKHYIEDNNLEKEVRIVVGEVWNDIEESLKLNRKPKY